MDPTDRGCFVPGTSAAKPTVKYLRDQRTFVDVGKHLGDGCTRHSAGNADRLELSKGAQAAVVLPVRLGTRAGQGRPPVVKCMFVAQPPNRCVDLLVSERP